MKTTQSYRLPCRLLPVLAAFFCTGAVASGSAPPVSFTVSQADPAWMPDATNLRWREGQLESLFFIVVAAEEPLENLSVAIAGTRAERIEPVAAIHPVTDAMGEEIIASDPTWFSLKGDLNAQKSASRFSRSKVWLPVELGRTLGFELRQENRKISSQSVTPALVTPVWWHSRWEAEAEDPVLHGTVLFPHHNLMVQSGRPVALALEFVGTGADEVVAATLTTSVRREPAQGTLWQKRAAVSIGRHRLASAIVNLPASELVPGNYEVTAELQDAAGNFVALVRRGLVVVPPRTVASRFGATYANLSTPRAVNADPAEEPPIFKVAREYHATHMGPDSDVVVSFDGQPDHIVFSHLNRGYTPFWYVDQLGIDWEWVEGHDDQLGSLEVQYDPECRYARVSIVASTPARAIVHWRYNTSSRYYDRFFDEWVDEFYTIYPDQTMVRKVLGYFRRHNWHETFEPYLVGPAGLHLGEVFEDKHISVLDLKGGRIDLDPLNLWKDWFRDWSALRGRNPADRAALLQFNLRGGRKLFYAFADLRRFYSLWSQFWWDGKTLHEAPGAKEQPFPQDTETPTAKALHSQVSSYCFFDATAALHQVRSLPDGRIYGPDELERESNNKMSQTKDMADVRIESMYAFLLGLNNSVDPVAIAQSWVAPAAVTDVRGAEFIAFAATERAYRLRAPTGPVEARFTFAPQPGKPQVNPVFVLEGVTANAPLQLTVDGRRLAADACRVGFESMPDGTFRAVVWTGQSLAAPCEIRIAGVRP